MRSIRFISAIALSAAISLPAYAQNANGAAAANKSAKTAKTSKPAKPTAAATRTAPAPTFTNFAIDATHSELSFRIRHLLGRVSGGFGEWGGTIAIDTAAPANSKVDVSVKTATIDTKNSQRDAHLRSPDFFAADSFPAITFKSTKVVTKGKALQVFGDLTIRGKTKPVVLVGEYGGVFTDPWGKRRTAFTASTKINRLDYGVAWNKAVETGAMLGDDVTIDIAIEAVQQ